MHQPVKPLLAGFAGMLEDCGLPPGQGLRGKREYTVQAAAPHPGFLTPE
jgi:hypothetical protein